MPWLPLAILLVAALTVAALALILFPPGEDSDDFVDEEESTPASALADDSLIIHQESEDQPAETEPAPENSANPPAKVGCGKVARWEEPRGLKPWAEGSLRLATKPAFAG